MNRPHLIVGFVLAGLGIAACGGEPERAPSSGTGDDARSDQGSARFDLKLAEGALVDQIHYVVRQGGALLSASAEFPNLPEGDLPVPGATTEFVFALELPVGDGFTIELTTSWDDPDDSDTVPDIECENAAGPVALDPIQAGVEASAEVVLLCRDVRSGDIFATVELESEACPDLHMAYAVGSIPYPYDSDTIFDGVPIDVRSGASHDVPGTLLSPRWSVDPPTRGFFVEEFSYNATFFSVTGHASADLRLTVTVSAITPDGGVCDDSLSFPLRVRGSNCGDFVTNIGETCDDGGAPGGCPDDCTQVCGDGVIEGTEQCELPGIGHPGTAACDGSSGPGAPCTSRIPLCGDNFVTPPELCDDGNTTPGDGCGSGCAGP